MRRGVLFTLFLFGHLASLASEDLSEALEYLSQNRLVVSLATRIREKEHQTVWHMENTKVTASGQAINLKMSGHNLVIFAEITPYMKDDKSILLVAKGEVFIANKEAGTKYYSTLKSLPVDLGEKVFFFPLGMAVDAEQNVYYIELEILVEQMDLPEGSAGETSPDGAGTPLSDTSGAGMAGSPELTAPTEQ